MAGAYLGLGSNLGERRAALVAALRLLAADPGIEALSGSSLYESRPVGVLAQPDFLNLVVWVRTTHAPLALLGLCLAIEARLGRERRERWGPRLIDVDVLSYEQLRWADDRLILPHPRLPERSFVLTPLLEITPDLVLPGLDLRQLSAQVGTAGLRRVGAWHELAKDAGIAPVAG